MENECPCIDCICVPVCQNKSWTKLATSCRLIVEYFESIEAELDADRHRDVELEPLNQSYQVAKSVTGSISWWVVKGGVAHITAFYSTKKEEWL